MKIWNTILIATFFASCGEDNKQSVNSPITWELIEIKKEEEEWEAVSFNEKHFLNFLEDSTVLYTNGHNTCTGDFIFEGLSANGNSKRLTLNVPCMVNEEGSWWTYSIIKKTDNSVIALPTLNPNVNLPDIYFKYRIIYKKPEKSLAKYGFLAL